VSSVLSRLFLKEISPKITNFPTKITCGKIQEPFISE